MQHELLLSSPDHRIEAALFSNNNGRLQFHVRRDDALVIEDADLGITVDGVDFGAQVELGEAQHSTRDEEYSTRGGHSLARDFCNVVTVPVTTGGVLWTLEARAFNDGFAFRYIVSGNGERTVNGEASSWKIPAGSKAWIAERPNNWKLKSYAGWWMSTPVKELPTISSQGPIQTPPMVIEFPHGGYGVLTEAALTNYSGMRLRATGERNVQAEFTEGEEGFVIDGEIITPWRVVMLADDLNALVNSDILTNLNPPPDEKLYADTRWIKPGRSVWRWWSSDTGTPKEEREFVKYAVELGFEYSIVDDGWEAWPSKWSEVSKICKFAREHNVGVFVWKDYKDVWQPEDNYRVLREFLDGVKAAGSCGVKLDFMNAESKDRIDFQMAALRETAKRQLMLLFHGCQKPSGEARTWPHEISREGIRGLELNKMTEGPITASHNAALPFTRFVSGHGDYTPVGYSNPGPTSWAHQLATAILFTSPLQVIAEHPEKLLHDEATQPALDVLKSIPSVWDETRVLAPSRIGEVAIMARRSSDTWFFAALNNEDPMHLDNVDLSFLGDRTYQAVFLSSPAPQTFERRELEITKDYKFDFSLNGGDGYVAWLKPVE